MTLKIVHSVMQVFRLMFTKLKFMVIVALFEKDIQMLFEKEHAMRKYHKDQQYQTRKEQRKEGQKTETLARSVTGPCRQTIYDF